VEARLLREELLGEFENAGVRRVLISTSSFPLSPITELPTTTVSIGTLFSLVVSSDLTALRVVVRLSDSKGKLSELIDVIIEEKTSLFVCAIGVPPKEVVEKLHRAKIPIMNMIGHPKHAKYALDAGVDIICCQGGEGGGHTGNVPTSVLVPAVVDAVKGKKSPLTGEPVSRSLPLFLSLSSQRDVSSLTVFAFV
jgi:hypothetical protein